MDWRKESNCPPAESDEKCWGTRKFGQWPLGGTRAWLPTAPATFEQLEKLVREVNAASPGGKGYQGGYGAKPLDPNEAWKKDMKEAFFPPNLEPAK